MLAFNTWEPQPASPRLGHMQSFLMTNKSLFKRNLPCPVGSEDQQMRGALGGAPGQDLNSIGLQGW